MFRVIDRLITGSENCKYECNVWLNTIKQLMDQVENESCCSDWNRKQCVWSTCVYACVLFSLTTAYYTKSQRNCCLYLHITYILFVSRLLRSLLLSPDWPSVWQLVTYKYNDLNCEWVSFISDESAGTPSEPDGQTWRIDVTWKWK